jgi:hypothetical protein
MGILKPKRSRLEVAPAHAFAATWWFLRAHRFAPPDRLQPDATDTMSKFWQRLFRRGDPRPAHELAINHTTIDNKLTTKL